MRARSNVSEALLRIREMVEKNGCHIVRSDQILRKDRELLLRTHWLQEIMKGWYLFVKPDVLPGDSTPWFANFWDFLRLYLQKHFADNYCLSAESSLDLHTGSSTIPRQVIIISSSGGGALKKLPFDTSLFIYADPQNIPEERVLLQGLQAMSLPYALCKATPTYFQKNPKEAEIALRLIRNASELSQIILKYQFKKAAERILGAYEFLQNKKMQEDLQQDLLIAGWKIKKDNPFSSHTLLIPYHHMPSPHAARIFSLWNEYRDKIIPYFPLPPKRSVNYKNYLSELQDLYDKDAYNSLSIEGYVVDNSLIEKVKNNAWNPDVHSRDHEEKNALAARGYFEAFEEVKQSFELIFEGKNPGEVIEKDLKKWYQKLFLPMVRANILRPEDLLGYRKTQVYIRGSRHIPLPTIAVPDAMQTLFECIKKEEHPAIRAVLGHYLFVYIHPYLDGNGRLGRFLMNTLLVTGGYPWTIIQAKNRNAYLSSLEACSSEKKIEPFAAFVAAEMTSS